MNEDLIAAWELWDARPANDTAAKLLVQACHEEAGILANELRKHMAACRRDGLSRRCALTEWELLHG